MQRKLHASDALMFAPILLIGGVGYWQQQRTQKSNQPTRIEVRSLQVLPPMPSDVARGFDTRVKLSLGYSGAEPRGWGISDWQKFSLTRISQPKASQAKIPSQKIEVRDVENRFDDKSDAYVGTYLMKLRDVSSDAPIVLKGSFQSANLQQTSTGVASVGNIAENLKWHAIVRKQDIKTPEPPRVSHFSGLKMKRIALDDRRKGKSSWDFDIGITCEIVPGLVNNFPAIQRITPMMDDVYLTDGKNRRYDCRSYSGLFAAALDKPDKPSASTVRLSFYGWEDFPQDTSDLTFHAQISVDDLWPLEIEIPVKDIPRGP